MGIALSAFSSRNLIRGNEARFNSDTGIVLSVGVTYNVVQGNEVSNNDFYGIGTFTRVDLGAPPPMNNVSQGNSSLANGRADLVEIVFDPFGDPRESVEEQCRNTWKGNDFVSQIGPPDCIQ
jgi:parallel beta-helix repeat protein